MVLVEKPSEWVVWECKSGCLYLCGPPGGVMQSATAPGYHKISCSNSSSAPTAFVFAIQALYLTATNGVSLGESYMAALILNEVIGGVLFIARLP